MQNESLGITKAFVFIVFVFLVCEVCIHDLRFEPTASWFWVIGQDIVDTLDIFPVMDGIIVEVSSNGFWEFAVTLIS